jgi:hypothetical protein
VRQRFDFGGIGGSVSYAGESGRVGEIDLDRVLRFSACWDRGRRVVLFERPCEAGLGSGFAAGFQRSNFNASGIRRARRWLGYWRCRGEIEALFFG